VVSGSTFGFEETMLLKRGFLAELQRSKNRRTRRLSE
jgi:hypothetical protein